MRRYAVFAIMLVAFSGMVHGQHADFRNADFTAADSVAFRYAAHPLGDLKGLADKLTAPLPTEQEKFRAIYRWVCSNIEVDYSLVLRNKRKREKLQGESRERWNRQFNGVVFERLTSDYKTICTGYAYLIRELAFHAGLSCEIINGHADPRGVDLSRPAPVNHSWNTVRINNRSYFCDATWSSGIIDRATGAFVKKFREQYFLADETLFARDHYMVHPIAETLLRTR